MTMKLQTTYLGLTLKNPLMPGASPLADDLDMVRRLEDAGAAAIVMHSLFEEQILLQDEVYHRDVLSHRDTFAEAQSFLVEPEDFSLAPDQYLEQIRRIKECVGIPVIASLNGANPGAWTQTAKLMEEAGADALEMNYYDLPCGAGRTGRDVERTALEILRSVRRSVTIPVAMKISPFFSSLPHFAQKAAENGADGLVLFNRFYQPDIDIEELEAVPTLQLSHPGELRLRLRWIAILRDAAQISLAASGGIHTATDVIKAVLVGADAVQMVAVLLKRGPESLGAVLDDLTRWMNEHEYESIDQLRGSMSLSHCPDPAAFERANYLQILQGWKA